MSRRLVMILEGALVVALVLVVSGFTRSDAVVELTVDGKIDSVETRGDTVGDLLDEQGVVVSERDLVEPSADTALVSGDTVTVRHARQVQVVIDGQPTQIWTTALTVERALEQFGVRAANAELSASRSERVPLTGARIGVKLPDQVTILHDQRRTTVVTTADTVAAVLREAQITLDEDDLLNVGRSKGVESGLQIVVTRVAQREVKKGFAIDYSVIRRADSSRYEGYEKVIQRGIDGRRVVITRVTRHDGVPVRERKIDRRVVSTPVRQIVVYGTKVRPYSAPATGAEGLNWGALAACESGGNPRAVNAAGYYGLYQFALSTWYSVGGSGNPIDATPDEQTYRAQVLYQRSGAGQWPVCGPLLFS
ncbi:MAG: ubiquitin-like domain-containing protein [Actinomycetes bacterium]